MCKHDAAVAVRDAQNLELVSVMDINLDRAKAVAAQEGTTLRRLVEEGLRLALERRMESSGFHLRDAGFGEGGVRSGVDLARWDEVRDELYQGRGG